jgi:quercetin dioxygenase-like cupin family protein
MFQKSSPDGYIQVLEGILMKTVSYGDSTLMSEFRLGAGRVLPMHAHPQEQTGYLVSGHMRLTIGSETFDVHPGDAWCIPGGVKHGAEIDVDSVAVEVFSPVREDYLPGGKH